MKIEKLDEILTKKIDVLPLIVQTNADKINIFHGNIKHIKFSRINNGKLELVNEIKFEHFECFKKALALIDNNNDESYTLICGIKPHYLRFYCLKNNQFTFQLEHNISKDFLGLSEIKDFEIRTITKILPNSILIGTNIGLMIYTLNKDNIMNFERKLFIGYSIWKLEVFDTEEEQNYLMICTEKFILFVDNKLNLIGKLKTNNRVYDVKILKNQKNSYLLFYCTKEGILTILNIILTKDEVKRVRDLYSKKLVKRKDRYSSDAINSLFIEDIDSNGKINLIIGGNDYKIKIFEWDNKKKILKNIFVYSEPIEEIYSMLYLKSDSNQFLIYTSYHEEVSINKIILYCYDYFLSYAGENRKVIKKIAKKLKKSYNRTVFYDTVIEFEIIGKNGLNIFREYIGVSKLFVVFFSKYYIISDWTKQELMIALEEEKRRKHNLIIPVKLDNTNIPNIIKKKIPIIYMREGLKKTVNLLDNQIVKYNKIIHNNK